MNQELDAECINPERARPPKPLCLFSALGLDRHVQSEEPQAATAPFEGGMVRHYSDESTQTETQMLSMQEVNSILDRVQQSLVEKLTPLLCTDRCDPASEELPDLPRDPLATCAASQCPPGIDHHPVGMLAGANVDVASSVDRPGSTELEASRPEASCPEARRPEAQQESSYEQKRQRREVRRHELEKRAGLT